jgi:hypothetical protein
MILAAVMCLSAHAILAQPTDNPIAAHYRGPEGYPSWTDRIHWDNVVDMSVFSDGADDFERFENARDQMYAQGGGVLYYPAGDYSFSVKTGPGGRGLMLKKGVVIRGEAPVSDASAVTGTYDTPGLGRLGTRFHFSFRDMGDGEAPWMWNVVGITPGDDELLRDVNDVGVAWVDIEGATVYMGLDADWDASWGESDDGADSFGEWNDRVPDGTHPLDPEAGLQNNSPYVDATLQYPGAGARRFIFGCRFRNATVSNWGIDRYSGGRIDAETFYYGGQRGAARIAVFGSHLFIANNAIVKPTKCFYYQQLTRDRKVEDQASINTVLFDYGKCNGITVNKDIFRGFVNRCNLDEGMYYEENIIVRDNWVYNHGGEGFALSGAWMIVQNNVNYRDYLDESGACYGLPGGYELTLSGFSEAVPIDDNQSRAFDMAGMNVWIDGNWYTGTGSTPGNDGEGILCQRIGAVELFSWAITRNSQGDTGENGYIAPYDTHVMGLFTAWNDQRGGVGVYKAVGNFGEDIAVVENGSSSVSGIDGENMRDFLHECPAGSPAAPANVTVARENEAAIITWTDQADNEIAFQVDRKIDAGEWHTIAYRPRHATGGEWVYPGTEFNGREIPGCTNQERDFNKQQWTDFTAPPGRDITYRVAAITCDHQAFAQESPLSENAGHTRAAPPARAPRVAVRGDRLHVATRGIPIDRIRLRTAHGAVIRTTRTAGQATGIDVSLPAGSLAPGVYFADLGSQEIPGARYVVPVLVP